MTINPQTIKALEVHIKSFVQSFLKFTSRNDEGVFFNCSSETARNIVNGWKNQIELEKKQLSAIRKAWPDGVQFINIFNEFIITQEEFYDNFTRWREFIETGMNTRNSKSMEEYQKFVLRNRELAPIMDDQLKAANELLKSETGLDIFSFGPNSVDSTKLDMSPEGLVKTKHYIDKVTEVLNEYNRLLLRLLELHNQAKSSLKLFQDEKWASMCGLLILQFWGVSLGVIPGKVTPADLDTIPGCQDVYLVLRNPKDLSQKLYTNYSELNKRIDSLGLEKVAGILNEIEKECKSLFYEIEIVNNQL